MKKLEKSVNQFMQAWREKDFSDMQNYLQKTWLAGPRLMSLEGTLGSVDIKSWKIQKTKRIGEACKDAIVNVTFKQNGTKNKRKLNIRAICEIPPHIPDISGEWGINPVSVMRGM